MQRRQQEPDYFAICTCLVHLNDPKSAASDLMKLAKTGGDVSYHVNRSNCQSYLIALQIAFDLATSATQEFLQRVQSYLATNFPKDPMERLIDGETAQPIATTGLGKVPGKDLSSLVSILSGETTIGMNLDFLFRSNKTDTVILNKIRDSLESRNSIFHSALTFANAYMHAGTTNDSFIRDNLEWLGRATNWAKFSATAALGVIHRGHLSQGQTLLAPYLPVANGSSSSVYTEGGSLFGLGLIFANHGASVSQYLSKQLQDANDEVVQHGAALGLGVAGIATADESIFRFQKLLI
jgi:26S proteasome regulatory subunit N2